MRLFNSLCQRKQNKNSFFIETVALACVTLHRDPVVYVTVTSTSIRGETGLIASHSVCCRNRPRWGGSAPRKKESRENPACFCFVFFV